MREARTAVLLLLMPVLGAVGAARGQAAQAYWPTDQGNVWEYDGGGELLGDDGVLKIVGGQHGWAKVDGLRYGRWLGASAESGRILVWDERTKTQHLLFDLGVGRGRTFVSDVPGAGCIGGTGFELVSDDETIATPAGTFEHCLVIRRQRSRCRDAGLVSVAFAPGVGVVEFTADHFTGYRTSKLTRAVVNGAVYPAERAGGDRGTGTADAPLRATVAHAPNIGGARTETVGHGVRLTLDRHVYALTEDRMPRVGTPPNRGRRYPATLRATLEIVNGTEETIRFDYRDGQRYDFVIESASGREVYRWSRGRRFAQEPARVGLAAGRTLTFEESIELAGFDGRPLAEGPYKLTAIHTTESRTLREEAEATFVIELREVY